MNAKKQEHLARLLRPDLSPAGTLKQSWNTRKPAKGQGRNRNPEVESGGCLRPRREGATNQNYEARKELLLSVLLCKSDGHTRDPSGLMYTEMWLVSFSGESTLCAMAGLR